MKNEMSCEKKSPVMPIAIGAGVTIFTLAYVVSPIDPIPDILVGLGQLDDLAVSIIGTAADIMLAIEAIKRLWNSISSSNTPAYAYAGDYVEEAEYVEI